MPTLMLNFNADPPPDPPGSPPFELSSLSLSTDMAAGVPVLVLSLIFFRSVRV